MVLPIKTDKRHFFHYLGQCLKFTGDLDRDPGSQFFKIKMYRKYQRSCIPFPSRILGKHFSILEDRVADCFAPSKYNK